MKKTIYLDYAAATPTDEAVVKAMIPFFNNLFFNPSATYSPALEVKRALTEARKKISFHLGAKPEEIIFTAGGSEANNLAIHGIMTNYSGKNLVVSSIEHDSVLEVAKNYDYKEAPVDHSGLVIIDSLFELVNDETVLISVMQANNEVGTIQPINEISKRINSIRHKRLESGNLTPLLLHSDAAQAANYLDLHHSKLGVDLMSLNGGKIYGPKQTGILFVKSGVKLKPLISGGGQESNLRSGTENVAGCIGLACALEIAQENRKAEYTRLSTIQQNGFSLIKDKLPNAVINGSIKKRLPNNLHITLPDIDNEKLLFLLDSAGVYCSAGSACSASSQKPSHVLGAMGISDQDARNSIRITIGRQTTQSDMERAIDLITEIITEKF